jgi:hypothetical protein
MRMRPQIRGNVCNFSNAFFASATVRSITIASFRFYYCTSLYIVPLPNLHHQSLTLPNFANGYPENGRVSYAQREYDNYFDRTRYGLLSSPPRLRWSKHSLSWECQSLFWYYAWRSVQFGNGNQFYSSRLEIISPPEPPKSKFGDKKNAVLWISNFSFHHFDIISKETVINIDQKKIRLYYLSRSMTKFIIVWINFKTYHSCRSSQTLSRLMMHKYTIYKLFSIPNGSITCLTYVTPQSFYHVYAAITINNLIISPLLCWSSY